MCNHKRSYLNIPLYFRLYQLYHTIPLKLQINYEKKNISDYKINNNPDNECEVANINGLAYGRTMFGNT